MNLKDRPRLADIALNSPHIEYSTFENYSRANASHMLRSPEEREGEQTFFNARENEAGVFSYTGRLKGKRFDAIRGEISRPGMTPRMSPKSKLVNDANESKDLFEEFRNDNISFGVYRRMHKDPTLSLGVKLLTGLISSLKYTISCKDTRVERLINEVYKRHHNSIVRSCMSVALREGFTFAEKVYQRENVVVRDRDDTILYEGAAVGINFLNWIDPDGSTLRYYKSRQTGDIAYVTQRVMGKGETKVDRKNLFWFAIDKEFNGVFGKSRFKGAYPYWYYDKINYQYALNTLEKSGAPHIEGRCPTGTTRVGTELVNNDELLANVLVDLSRDGLVMLPSTRDDRGEFLWTVEYKEPNNNGIESFEKFSKYNERKKYQMLGIPDAVLISEANASETDSKIDLLLVIVEDLVDQIQEQIHTDIINYLVAFNFGDEYKSQVDFKIDRSGLGRRKVLKEIVNSMLRVQGSMSNYKGTAWPDMEKALNELGISTTNFDRAFEKDSAAGNDGESPLDEMQRDEDSNDINRATPDERDRERDAKQEDSVKD